MSIQKIEARKNITLSDIALYNLKLLMPFIEFKGFIKKLKLLLELQEPTLPSIIPDAFFFDVASKTIYIYEVEDTNPIDRGKLLKLAELWQWVDAEGWNLEIIATNRWGKYSGRLNFDHINSVAGMFGKEIAVDAENEIDTINIEALKNESIEA